MMKNHGYVTSFQERQMMAMRAFYPKPKKMLTKVDELMPLEKTRLYEPFDVETVRWIAEQFRKGGSLAAITIKFGCDGTTGRGFIEY